MAVYKSSKPTKDGRAFFFRVKYKDVFGVAHDYSSQKYKTKKEAEFQEAYFRTHISSSCNANPTVKEVFFEYIEYKRSRIKPQSISILKWRFKSVFTPLSDIHINGLSLSLYRSFIAELERAGYSVNYKNKINNLLKELIRYSARCYNTDDSLLKFMDSFRSVGFIKKEMDFYTLDEFNQFISVVDDLELRAFFKVLYYLGLRFSEARALKFSSIHDKMVLVNGNITNQAEGSVWIYSSPKTANSIRELPIPDTVYNDLMELKKTAMGYSDYSDDLFIFGLVNPLNPSFIYRRKNEFCKLAHLRQIRIHDFRHSCASLLIHSGASITLVSKYLGHSSVSLTLNTYTHMYKSELLEISNVLNKL